jgi:hypothetical protein
MSTRITAAHAVTLATEQAIDKADRALHADRFCNGYGVYSDRSTVLANLGTARTALDAALATLRGCCWPTDLDYGEG